MITCPNCHSQQPENVNFCTNCGFSFSVNLAKKTNLTKIQNIKEPTKFQQQFAPSQDHKMKNIEQAKTFASNYWSYFLNAIKHPTILENGHKYFGFTTIILFAIFNDIFVKLIMDNVAKSVNSSLFSGLFNTQSTYAPTIDSSVYAKLFFLTLLTFAIYILIGFFVRNVVLGDKSDTLLSFTNRFTHYLMINLVLAVLSMIFMLLGMRGLAVFMYALMALIMSIAFILSIIIDTNPLKIDKLYIVVIGQLLLALVFMIVMSVFAVSLAANIASIISAAGF
ncbi:DUF6574 domain-containing protein [Dellaglioa sp. P0083]|uniref:DUF6574 domain-containing protein n=1 Tax=Dellaglioa kimchii TaxID=3344667 RepID=UPI0038D46FF8